MARFLNLGANTEDEMSWGSRSSNLWYHELFTRALLSDVLLGEPGWRPYGAIIES